MAHHFLKLEGMSPKTLRAILDEAHARKRARAAGGQALCDSDAPLQGFLLVMLFAKSSTRTRISFDVAMRQLGGEALVVNFDSMQIAHGESLSDTASVLARYADILMMRTDNHNNLEEMAANDLIPIINGLSDRGHPCQILADIMTFEEHRGAIKDKHFAWVGDANNMAASWLEAAHIFGFHLRFSCPDYSFLEGDLLSSAEEKGFVERAASPEEAVRGADCVMTDTWHSLADDKQDRAAKARRLQPYAVDETLMARAQKDALFMHCLPAHRGEEVSAGVIDGAQSVVFDEAENRLHVQKGLLLWCLGKL